MLGSFYNYNTVLKHTISKNNLVFGLMGKHRGCVIPPSTEGLHDIQNGETDLKEARKCNGPSSNRFGLAGFISETILAHTFPNLF